LGFWEPTGWVSGNQLVGFLGTNWLGIREPYG
jgi:hypothetical protein